MGIRQYTDEETSDLEHIYLNVTQDINQIAEGLGRDRRSIISKLGSMKIYINPPEKPRKRSVKLFTCQLQDLLGIRFSGILTFRL